jgi:2-iminobutanoate/2-iminopropanoate deaminase
MKKGRETIATDGAPAAIGPYSQAVRAGNFLFLSGQIGLDPASGKMVPGGVREQTARVLENMKAVLAAAGLGINDVVKANVYMKDLSAFGEMNAVYAEVFKEPYPARAAVGVKDLPKGALVEIEAIAMAGD